MTRAVILAAGDGGRLGEHTADLPKPLVPVAGRPLIAYTLESLAAARIAEIAVVVGYRSGQLTRAMQDGMPGSPVTFIQNERFHGGASLSLRAARSWAGAEPFLLLMADHMLSAPIVQRLLAATRAERTNLVATDASHWPPTYADEATRVRLAPDSQAVVAIGKGLTQWGALDTGAFLLAPSTWEAVDACPEDCELGVIFQELARRGELDAVDVSGEAWYDVDTAEDLAAARRMVARSGR